MHGAYGWTEHLATGDTVFFIRRPRSPHTEYLRATVDRVTKTMFVVTAPSNGTWKFVRGGDREAQLTPRPHSYHDTTCVFPVVPENEQWLISEARRAADLADLVGSVRTAAARSTDPDALRQALAILGGND